MPWEAEMPYTSGLGWAFVLHVPGRSLFNKLQPIEVGAGWRQAEAVMSAAEAKEACLVLTLNPSDSL